MSLLPFLFSAWWADLDRTHRLMDQNFGLGLRPDQLVFPSAMDRCFSPFTNRAALEFCFRPLAEFMRENFSEFSTPRSGTSTTSAENDTFKVMLDVQQFKPEEINVKLSDRFIMVEAKHEEKRDEHGFISRQFARKYQLPEQVDEEKLASTISSDGILTITAPWKEMQGKANERTIKIEQTGKPAARSGTGKGAPTAPEEFGREEPGRQEPGREERGRQEPGREERGRQEPGREERGRQEPGREERGRQEPGQEEPGRQEPGQEEQSREEATENPKQEKPEK